MVSSFAGIIPAPVQQSMAVRRTTMKLLILSDLHLEHFAFDEEEPSYWPISSGYDAVVLAGDIHSGPLAIKWAAKAFGGSLVFYVPGNHEYYGALLQRRAIEMRATAKGFPNVILLDNDCHHIGNLRFLGSTLWTDFRLFGDRMDKIDSAMAIAGAKINDYRHIRFGSLGWMTPSNCAQMAMAAQSWLNARLAEPFNGKTVVITHHLPCMASVAPRHRNDPLTAAFANELSDMVRHADLWIHGHTHDSADNIVEGCRVVCNPAGYPVSIWSTLVDGRENPRFNPGFIVDTDDLIKYPL